MDYIQGQTIHPYALFTDIAEQPVDPTVTVVVTDPDGTVSFPTATSSTVGRWTFELLLEDSGIYRWEFHGDTDEGVAVCKGQACAEPSIMAGVS